MKTERAESVANLVEWVRVGRYWPDHPTRRGAVYRATILGAPPHTHNNFGHASLIPLIVGTALNIANVDLWGRG